MKSVLKNKTWISNSYLSRQNFKDNIVIGLANLSTEVHLQLCFIERPVNINDQINLMIISNSRSLNAETSQLHISSHPSCAQCGEVFMSEIEFKKHMQTHEANIVVSTYQVTKYVQTQSGSKGGGVAGVVA